MQQPEQNDLEQGLRLAADEPAHRPRFFELLLNANILILGTTVDSNQAESGVESAAQQQGGGRIQLQHWQKNDGSTIIPFFTSLAALQRAIKAETNYIEMPARAFFEMTQGANVVLNPYSDYGKEFTPEEINGLLLNGGKVAPEQRQVSRDTTVFLGQPATYPSQLVDSLTQLFAQYPQVKKAYLAMMQQSQNQTQVQAQASTQPNLVVGLELAGDLEAVISACGSVVRDVLSSDQVVDFCQVDASDNSTLSQYFINETEPFYQQRWGCKLKAWLGKGRA